MLWLHKKKEVIKKIKKIVSEKKQQTWYGTNYVIT